MTALALSTFDISPEEFRRRVDWARSQGTPRWLWPDISIERWGHAREVLTSLVGEVLSRESSDVVLNGDPAAMSLAAYTAGIGPLLGWWIGEGRIRASEEIGGVFDLHLRHNRLRMERMRSRAIEVLHALDQRGIDATVLKGMHTAFAYFPDPSTRPSSDLDLLVRASDADAANMFLQEAGFARTYQSTRETSWTAPGGSAGPSSLLLTHADDPWTVDLHCSLDYQPRATVSAARLDLVDLPSERSAWPAGPVGFALGQPLLLLHIATHASCPLESLTPLRMIEMALIIRRDVASGALRWDAFLDQAHRSEALGLVFPALYFTDRLAPDTIPEHVLEISAAAAPKSIRNYVTDFTPATIQAIHRISLRERLAWSDGWYAAARQIGHDFLPAISSRHIWKHYCERGMKAIGWRRSDLGLSNDDNRRS